MKHFIMNARCYFWALVLVLSSCNQQPLLTPKDKQKEAIADSITNQVALKLKNEYNLRPIGSGGGMMRQIRMLALSFQYYKPITIEEGRKLLIASVNAYLDAVNANESIQPFLDNRPFNPKNIEIRIFLQNPDHSKPSPQELQVISSLRGVLRYKIDDPNGSRFLTVLTETYEEAVQKLNEQQGT